MSFYRSDYPRFFSESSPSFSVRQGPAPGYFIPAPSVSNGSLTTNIGFGPHSGLPSSSGVLSSHYSPIMSSGPFANGHFQSGGGEAIVVNGHHTNGYIGASTVPHDGFGYYPPPTAGFHSARFVPPSPALHHGIGLASYAPSHLPFEQLHACNNLILEGNTCKQRGDVDGATRLYQQALSIDPACAIAHSNLANCLKEKGHVPEALHHYRTALNIDPNFADAWSNMGNLFKDQGNPKEAVRHYQKAIELSPNHPDAHMNLGSASKDLGDVDRAISAYSEALRLRPDFPDALAHLVYCLSLVCDWKRRDELLKQLVVTVTKQINQGQPPSLQPYHCLVYDGVTQEFIIAVTRAFAKSISQSTAVLGAPRYAIPPAVWRGPESGERLRVGYISSDFGDHPLSQLMQTMFGMHDRATIETFGYALARHPGHPARLKIEQGFEHFFDIADEPSVRVCERIRNEHRVHILINLNGYTKGARNDIFALRPCKIQVHYMGYAGTMAADWIDYMITDAIASPPWCRHLYVEKLCLMPHSYFVNDHRQTYVGPKATKQLTPQERAAIRTQLGIPVDAFVFACFNQLHKITKDIWEIWLRILTQCPNTCLWLLRFPPTGEKKLRETLSGYDASVRNRVIFTDVTAKDEYMRRIPIADLFLDTPVYNGHTTVTDALWAGLPILTVSREQMASRVAAGLCCAVGMPEFIAKNLQEYEAKAIYWSSHLTGRCEIDTLRQRLWANRDTYPFFDTQQWVRDLECLLKVMAQKQTPSDIDYYQVKGLPIPSAYVTAMQKYL